MEPDCKPIRLILQVVRRSSKFISFVVARQTLTGDEFNENLPGDLMSSDDMDEADYNAMDYVWLGSETAPEWNGHDTLYMRGDDPSQDYNVMKARPEEWVKIKRSIMMYNQEFSNNTLTEEDVIWES